VTIEAVADRSGVAKTTIYRWWPNRAALVVDLLLQVATAAVPMPAGKDPLRSVRSELGLVARALEGLTGRLLLSVLGEAQHDPAVRAVLQRGLFGPRRKATAQVVRQAQASGALRPDVPPLLVVDLLFGPLFYRKFVLQERVTGGFVKQVFERVLSGLRSSRRGEGVTRGAGARRMLVPPRVMRPKRGR
jgi:AcrR family transcriptional regulator